MMARVKEEPIDERCNGTAEMKQEVATENLLPLPPAKAKESLFPPGCPVLYMSGAVVHKGTVESVSINLAPGSSREDVYTVERGRHVPAVVATASQLQLAPMAKVWFQPPEVHEWRSGTIRGAYQDSEDSAPLYSVQEIEPATAFFHGISGDCIRYRFRHSQPPTSSPQQAPKVANDNAMSSVANKVVVPATDEQKASTWTPDPSSSSPKRTLPSSDQPHISDDTSSGSYTAELRFPPWRNGELKLDDAFVEQMCVAVVGCTNCRARVLQTAPKVEHGVTLQPRESIFVFGSDKDSVNNACILVSNLLREHLEPNERERLEYLLSSGWTSSGGNKNFDSPPASAKRAKLTHSTPPTDARTHTSPTAEANDSTYAPSQINAATSRTPQATGDAGKNTTHVVESSPTQSLDAAGQLAAYGASPPQDESAKEMEPVGLNAALSSSRVAAAPGDEEPGKDTEPSALYAALSSSRAGGSVADDASSQVEFRIDLDSHAETTQRLLKIPKFVDKETITCALIGDRGNTHKKLVKSTGCQICIDGLNSKYEPTVVVVKGPASRLQSAVQLLEDKIFYETPDDQKGRLLYFFAKLNHYGAGNGVARLQRSPDDLNKWKWLACVGFRACNMSVFAPIFIGRGGVGVKKIIRDTNCPGIKLISSCPGHFLVYDTDEDKVNNAVDAINRRVESVLDRMTKFERRDSR